MYCGACFPTRTDTDFLNLGHAEDTSRLGGSLFSNSFSIVKGTNNNIAFKCCFKFRSHHCRTSKSSPKIVIPSSISGKGVAKRTRPCKWTKVTTFFYQIYCRGDRIQQEE